MDDCIFCKIIKKEIPAEMIFESDDMIVFKDINPKVSIHLLFVPKKHIVSIATLQKEDQELIGKIIFQAKLIAKEQSIDESGFKIIVNAGDDGGQLVPHLHFHLLGGEKLGGLV